MKLNLIIFSFFALVFCGQIKSQTACGDDVFTLFQKSHIRDFEKIEKANNLQIKNLLYKNNYLLILIN